MLPAEDGLEDREGLEDIPADEGLEDREGLPLFLAPALGAAGSSTGTARWAESFLALPIVCCVSAIAQSVT